MTQALRGATLIYMTTNKNTDRQPARSGTTMAELKLDPVSAARKRIEVCERYGMAQDPRDIAIVEADEAQ